MTDDEYREFLAFLFEHHVRPRLPRVRRRFHRHMMEEWQYHLDQAQQSAQVLRFIEMHCLDVDEIYSTFKLRRLGRAVSETRHSLDFSKRVAEEAGFLDAFEDHAQQILSGLQPQHLPDIDKDVLRESGSINPDVELRAMVLRAKAVDLRVQGSRQARVRDQMEHASARLGETEQLFSRDKDQDSTADTPKLPRRWFKGLGQIAQGAAFSIANVALAVGAVQFPVSPETQTWGALASVATGIGTILNGIGDLRNE